MSFCSAAKTCNYSHSNFDQLRSRLNLQFQPVIIAEFVSGTFESYSLYFQSSVSWPDGGMGIKVITMRYNMLIRT